MSQRTGSFLLKLMKNRKVQSGIAIFLLLVIGVVFYFFYWKKKNSTPVVILKREEDVPRDKHYINELLLSQGELAYIFKNPENKYELKMLPDKDAPTLNRFTIKEDGTIFVDNGYQLSSKMTSADKVHALVLAKSKTAKLLELDYESYYKDVPYSEARDTQEAWEKNLIPTTNREVYYIFNNIAPDGSEYELIVRKFDTTEKFTANLFKDSIVVASDNPNTVVCRIRKVTNTNSNHSYLEIARTKSEPVFHLLAVIALATGKIIL